MSPVDKQSSEELDQEPLADDQGAVDPHDNGNTGDNRKEPSSWISIILPHLSIPFPSVPVLSTRNLFHHQNSKSKNENEETRTGASDRKVRHPRRRVPSRSGIQHPPMNHLELSRTNSSYPECMEVRKAPNTRLQAVRASLPIPAMPKFVSQRPRDPFECLNGQDIVLLGGYRGSILRDATSRKRLWVPLVKAGLNFRKVDLAIPLDDGADEETEHTVVADGMLTKMGPVEFSNRLVTKLRGLEKQGKCRVHIFGYDWRISPHLISRKLQQFLEVLPSNERLRTKDSGALVIAHSMGGLIAHHALQKRPELFYGTVYCGTPFQHCVNILGPFKRGDALLANREILSSSVNFSMRSSFVFLPESGECFIDRRTHEKYRLDFFDHNTWLKYGLSPCVSDVGEDIAPSESPSEMSAEGQVEYAKKQAKLAVPHPKKIFEPRMEPTPPSGAKPPKLKHDREQAIEYLKRTLDETLKFKRELQIQPSQTPLVHPPLAVVYAVNTATVRGALVEGMEEIKLGNWWDFTCGPGDGVVLAKSAQLPEGFVTVAKVKSNRGHIQLMSDLEAVGTALEAVVIAKQARESLFPTL
jgi:hypothetical protein